MVEIDGSTGEGGGQILRTSLSLALATGRPVRIFNLRANRPKPGLMRQHLTAVLAAAEIGSAETRGAELHSRDLTFRPGRVGAGEYHFSIGTAGSVTLVLQTILPVLITADGPSRLVLEGGTHNDHAPPFDFVEKTFLPLINRMGPHVKARLDRWGFYPAGGGRIEVQIEPASTLARLDLVDRGRILSTRARAVVAHLPRHIAERELTVVGRKLGLGRKQLEVVEETRSAGPGNVLMIEIPSAHLTEVVTGFGSIGVPAEKVAARAAREAREYLDAEVPVGTHLADQLLLPLALAGGGSYRTLPLTAHSRTNIEVIQRFLDVPIVATEQGDGSVIVAVGAAR
ncbi:MAG TPA: RNA 3'-terminal phosphate cyclase [Planctomycetaceae bacterium]|nr:RNA 3'-terminal phosphate cyclase [Planctomycetaceae bacterium]